MDYKVDMNRNGSIDNDGDATYPLDRSCQVKARRELKRLIQKQRIQIEKNTRLYKELNSRIDMGLTPQSATNMRA